MPSQTMPDDSGSRKPQPNRAKLVTDLSELTARCRQGLPSKVEKFTKKVLAALVPTESGAKQILISSAALPCAYILVEPSGHVRGTVQHRALGTRRTIADFRIETLEQYERRAREVLAAARQGRSLLDEERSAAQRKRTEQTIAMVVDRYLAESDVKKKRSYPEKSRYLRVVWRAIHDESAETVDRHALLPTLRRIATDRGERTANIARDQLSAMFVWSIEHGQLRRGDNPAMHLPRWAERRRERALSLEELAEVWRAAPQVSEAYGAVVHLLEITGCRRAEIGGLRRNEVDLDRALITLPGTRTKNGRTHLVPLPPAAVEILKKQPKLDGDRIFPPISWGRMKERLDKIVELKPSFVLHDLRRSFSTGCHEHLNADVHLIELTINHVSGSRSGVAGLYDRSERLAERRRLLERWAELILHAAGEPVASAQVVNLR